MAPAGPPSDPPDRPDEPRGREADDWDWGDDWDAHAPTSRRPDGRRTGPSRDDEDDVTAGRPGDATAAGGSASRDASEPADAPASDPATSADPADRAGAEPERDRPADRAGARSGRARPASALHPSVVLRRRATAAGVLAVVLVLLVAVVAIASGGGDDDGDRRPAATTDGGALRSLTGVAARAADDQAERSAALARYARIGRPIYCGAGKEPWVALTFDDGPGPLSPRWIALMAKERVPMTLFRIGRNVPGNEEYVRVQRNLGWDSGSHTQNHPALATLSAKDQREEIVHGDEASERALGRPVQMFRPPYESHDARTDRIVEDLRMVEILWNVDTQDSIGASVDQIVQTAEKGMRPGSIILMHEVKPNTLAAMPRIIAALRQKGLKPVTVSRMLASDGPSEAQLRKGYDGCQVDLTPGKASS